MRKQLIIIGIIVLFVLVGLSGCVIEDEKADYIKVTVTLTGGFWKSTNNIMRPHEPVSGVELKLMMVKDGGERMEFYRTTDEGGETSACTHTFNVYKEQPVELTASLFSEVPAELKNYTIGGAAYAVIPWAQIDGAADLGGSYSTSYSLSLFAYPPTN